MRLREHRIPVFLFVAVVAIAVSACAPEGDVGDDTAMTATVTPQETTPTDTMATAATTGTAGEAPGHQAFLALRCEMCHSVSTAGITGSTETGPDLAGVSARRSGEDLAAFISGDDHPGEWKGTPEQATQIATWLATQ